MKNPILKEIRRVTGWHFLIDHEAFPLLLAAITSTSVLWFFPGIARIHTAYFRGMHQAAVVRVVPAVMQYNAGMDGDEPAPTLPL
jgi:hypothetical protein